MLALYLSGEYLKALNKNQNPYILSVHAHPGFCFIPQDVTLVYVLLVPLVLLPGALLLFCNQRLAVVSRKELLTGVVVLGLWLATS